MGIIEEYKECADYMSQEHRLNTPFYRLKYRSGKKSALAHHKEWDLDFDSYLEIIKDPCYYCGSDLIEKYGLGLDRIDNQQGYHPDNVLPCCGDCNKLRSDRLTVEETLVAVSAILAYRKSLSLGIKNEGENHLMKQTIKTKQGE